MGPKWVVFAGSGEPLLGDMSLGLIEYANSMAMRSAVFTNGILVSKDIARFFSRKS